jgi:hypothetical protein
MGRGYLICVDLVQKKMRAPMAGRVAAIGPFFPVPQIAPFGSAITPENDRPHHLEAAHEPITPF